MKPTREHLAALGRALDALDIDRLDAWGRTLAAHLGAGGRLLAAGNGGSAAEAQHLTAELVGRFLDPDRAPLSALALHAETSSLTACGNDHGYEQVYARGVRAHGRPDDVLLCLSTSGSSPNLLAAVAAAREQGMRTWALTGRGPSALAELCDEVVAVDAEHGPTVQEAHLVAVHLLCRAVDVALAPGAEGVKSVHERAGVRPLVVVGDLLLDRDWDGQVERVAPDAPVPVVRDPEETARPGGAGLAAALAARGSRPVVLVTAVGRDAAGARARSLLAAAGVEILDLGLNGPTPEKIRVKAAGQALLRVDRGDGPARRVGPPPEAVGDALRGAAAVLVADYGRGMTSEPALRATLAELPADVPVVWDPHPRGADPVPGVLVVTPNRAEARAGVGPAAVTRRARELAAGWGAVNVCVTLGEEGALLVGADGGPPLAIPAERAERGDPCGAGDAFAAALALALADGALPSEAARRAVRTAAAWVAGEDEAVLAAGHAPRAAEEDARAVIARVRAGGGTVVATGGCFDILHAGHVAVLQEARQLGDCLVVCLNSDDSISRLKGEERPVVCEDDRIAVLRGLGCVDAVVVFEEDTPERMLDELRPDLWVKGGDYRVPDLPEAALLETWGGQAVVLPFVPGHSTSRIIEEVQSRGR